MANKSSNSNKKETKTTTTTTKKSSSGGSFWSLNKISFYTLCAAAILYLISMILSACGINFRVVGALQGVATAFMIGIVSVNAWRFVAKKQTVWKVLYVFVLLVIIVGIILPLVL